MFHKLLYWKAALPHKFLTTFWIEAFEIRLTDIVYLGKDGMESATLLHRMSPWTCYIRLQSIQFTRSLSTALKMCSLQCGGLKEQPCSTISCQAKPTSSLTIASRPQLSYDGNQNHHNSHCCISAAASSHSSAVSTALDKDCLLPLSRSFASSL